MVIAMFAEMLESLQHSMQLILKAEITHQMVPMLLHTQTVARKTHETSNTPTSKITLRNNKLNTRQTEIHLTFERSQTQILTHHALLYKIA
jgi:hypothetical protein